MIIVSMLKRFVFAFLAFSLFFTSASPLFAKTTVYKAPVVKAAETVKPTPSPVPTPVNSFELFWPMVAGKTVQSKLYFLKTLKEKIRGFFIFGSAQKADYDIFIGIKRMLEAEVLMKAQLTDLANRTLDSASSDFDKANNSLTNAKNSSDVDQDTKNEINIRVSNLKKFVITLEKDNPSFKDKLQSVMDKLNSLTI